jgi:hypothetical protein
MLPSLRLAPKMRTAMFSEKFEKFQHPKIGKVVPVLN